MNKITPWSLLAICLVLISCKSDIQTEDQLAAHVPVNALFVASVNPERIMQKTDYEEVKNYDLFKKAFDGLKDSIPIFADILEKPRKSGIDFSQNAYFFVVNNPQRKRQIVTTLVLPLDDPANFESLVRASSKATVQSHDAFQIVLPLKGESVVAWNHEKAMLFGFSRGRRDMAAISELFNISEEASVASNQAFAKGFRGDHDLKFFISSNPIVGNLPPSYLLGPSMAGISKDALKDNHLFGSWDFETGKMDGVITYDIKDELTKHYSLFFKDDLSTDFSKLLPSEGLNTVNTYALNLKGIHQGFVEKSVINMVDGFLKASNLEFKDVAASFGGDAAIAIYQKGEDEIDYLGITDISDEKVVQQLLDYGVKANYLKKINNQLYTSVDDDLEENPYSAAFYNPYGKRFQLFKKEQFLYYSTSPQLIQQIQAAKFKPLAVAIPEVKPMLKQGTGGFYTDFQNGPLRKWMKIKELDYAVGKSSREKATIEVSMFNKTENSLKTILQSMNNKYQERKSKAAN